MKGLGRVCLGSLAGAALGAASFLTIEALMPKPAFAESGNWFNFAKSIGMDLDSARLQPNGVTTYRIRSRVRNPINGSYFFVYFSRALDCETMEAVTLSTGEREPFEPWKGAFTDKTQFAQVAHRMFCAK